MNLIKKVAGHVYFFTGILMFFVTMLPIAFVPCLISLLIKEPYRARIVHPACRIWMGIFMPLMGCPVSRKGKKHFKKDANYVVVVNHSSLVDIPVSTPWIPGPNKTLAKVEFAKMPFFGVIYRAGSILVNRDDEASRKESFTKMQQTLKQGINLCLYPEGTRNKTAQPLIPFYDGAFVVAIRAQKPIVPAVILGTKPILPGKPKFWARPHAIQYHFLEPIETTGMTLGQRDELKDKVYNIMQQFIIQNTAKASQAWIS
ncbi:MAG: lysophospholipid acyltransferase family protein [Edaphocola sp.]